MIDPLEVIRGFMKLLDDQVLVRNTDNDSDFKAFTQQALKITTVLENAKKALECESISDGKIAAKNNL
jgi:hypothetical protein